MGTTMENSMEVPQKIKNRIYDWAISLLGIYLQKTKILTQKDTSTPMFASVLFTIAKIQKQPQCPSMDEWIKKWWYTYTIEYYSAIKRRNVLPFATTSMDCKDIMLSE